MNEDRRDVVLGKSAPDWFELDRDPRATLVKSGHHRQTWRVNLNNEVIFAKAFDAERGGPFRHLVYALGLGPAHREWRASRAAEQRGVPAVRCLALGVDRRRSATVLLSEALPDAVPLSQAWERGASSRATTHSMIEAVAQLFAAAHDRGFVHRDAHPSNILIQPLADRGWEASFVDLHGAYLFKDPASKRCAVRSLAQIDHYFHRRATRSQRLRFLQNYVSSRLSFKVIDKRHVFCRELLTSIARARATHAEALARQRDRRIHRNGKYFATLALGNGWKGTFVLQLERRHAFPEPAVPDRSEHDWRNLLQALFMSDGWQRNDDAIAASGVYVERARPIGMREKMLWSLNGSPQRKRFIRSHQLRHRDIKSELILGFLEHRGTAGLIDETILLSANRNPECIITPCSMMRSAATGRERIDAQSKSEDQNMTSNPSSLVALWYSIFDLNFQTRHLRSGFGMLRRAIRPWLRSAAMAPLAAVSMVRADIGGDVSHIKQRVQTLSERVTELAGGDDLLDTLYFGWSDRPNARATLAILIKVAESLNREADFRGLGNGKIDDATVESMLKWSDDAIQRVIRAQPTDEFRPHRMGITWKQLLVGKGVPPLCGFLDGSRLTPQRPAVGDLDVLASLGQRFYARPLDSRLDEQDAGMTARRAEALGMPVFDVTPQERRSAWESGNHLDLIRPLWGDRRQYVAYMRSMSLFRSEPSWSQGNPQQLPAVEEPKERETLPASLARRAMLRGVMAMATYAAYRWTPPIVEAAPQHAQAALAATLWVQALEGQRLTLVDGWRDAHDENKSGEISIFLDPARTETIAHTALDLLRFADFLRGYDDTPLMAIAVGEDAFTHETDNPNEVAGWSDWTETIWAGLLARQVRFDVVLWESKEEKPKPSYRLVFHLENASRPTGGSSLERIERGLAQLRDHVNRLTAREMDGKIAADVFARAGQSPEGKACAAVVNLSDRSRVLKLRGIPAIGASRDVITNQQIPEPGQRVEFGPWQVRLLWPSE